MNKKSPSKTRIVFMGTPDFAVPSLKALYEEGFTIEAVVTQPDRPRGRGRRLRPSPVKEFSQSVGLRVFQPEKASDPDFVKEIQNIAPDFLVVAAYGQILKRPLLECAKIMPINVHGSLLPRLRGAAPIQRAILEGESRTGITIMKMDEGMDTGPILLMEGFEIGPDETFGQLHDRMARLGAELVVKAIYGILKGEITPKEQPNHGITYAPPIKKEELEIDWSRPATFIHRQIRAFDPSPSAFTFFGRDRVRLFTPRMVDRDDAQQASGVKIGVPGEVLDVIEDGLLVKTGAGGVILIKEIQWPGKKRMAVRDFIRGNPIPRGLVLGRR